MSTGAGANGRRSATIGGLRLAVALITYSLGAIVYRYLLHWNGRPGLVTVVIATALVALLLHLLDGALGRVADRIVYGSGADGQRIVRGLLRRMAGTLPVDEVVPRLAEAAGRTIGGPRAEVRVSLTDGRQWSQVWPPNAPVAGSAVTAGIRHGGATIGEIEVDLDKAETGPTEQRLLAELAAPAGLALSTVRLTVELRQRVAELSAINAALRASTERMLTARRDEQHRLRHEVDEHVVRHIRLAGEQLASLNGANPTVIGEAGESCERALDELRVIARGIYPPRLAEAGLLVSIDGWLQKTRLHADMAAGTDLDVVRRNPELEACLYFCAVTALDTLASAGGRHLSVAVDESAAGVRLQATAQDIGTVNGGAVAAMRDRIEAFDGSLTFDDRDARDCVMTFSAPLPAAGDAA
jgi:hypothetical protein